MTSIRIASLAAVLLALAGCTVHGAYYDPYPGYYRPPAYGPTIVYREGYRGHHHHGHHRGHQGWRQRNNGWDGHAGWR